MGKVKKFFRSIKKFPDWIYWLPAKIHWLYFNICFRKKIVDPNGFHNEFNDTIVLTWHNRLFFFLPRFPVMSAAEQLRSSALHATDSISLILRHSSACRLSAAVPPRVVRRLSWGRFRRAVKKRTWSLHPTVPGDRNMLSSADRFSLLQKWAKKSFLC